MAEEELFATSASNQKRVAAWIINRLWTIAQTAAIVPESMITPESSAAMREEMDVLNIIHAALGWPSHVYREAAPAKIVEVARMFQHLPGFPDSSSGGGSVQ